MRLDHLSYAAGPEGLAACVQRLGSHLGAAFSDGGLHPSFGTRNFVLPLKDGCYLEVVDVLDHPAADRAPFGQAVRARRDAGGGWLGWAIRVDDITAIESRLGRRAAQGHRRRPDGFDLRWKQIGVLDLMDDPQLPFFLQWFTEEAERPSAQPPSPIEIERMELGGNGDAVSQWLGEPADHPLDGIDVDWLSGDEPGLAAVHFATPHGPVRID